MIDVTFLKQLANPGSRHDWLWQPRRIILDGDSWYCATQGSIAVAVLVSAAAPLEADPSPEMEKRVAPFLSPPASMSLAYGDFRAWVGPVVEAKVSPCTKCDGRGKYDCHCDEPCCQGYVDPCDDCEGAKTVTEQPEPRYAQLGAIWVNRVLLATAFAHLDATEANIRFPDDDLNPVLVSSAAWRVAFMPLNRAPDGQELGEAFVVESLVEAAT